MTPKDKLEPVIEQYKLFQKEQQAKKARRKNEDRRVLRTLSAKFDDESMKDIKNTFFNKFLDDFAEEQYCLENPYEDLNAIDDEEITTQESD